MSVRSARMPAMRVQVPSGSQPRSLLGDYAALPIRGLPLLHRRDDSRSADTHQIIYLVSSVETYTEEDCATSYLARSSLVCQATRPERRHLHPPAP